MADVGPILARSSAIRSGSCSTRQFQLVPNYQAAGRHVDGWPVSIRKMFILPRGVGAKSGTTWFRLRDGREVTLSSDGPIWAVFENSVVWHAPIFAQEMRPTIELDFAPARETSFEPYYAGTNGWYPWFPTEAGLLEGTRMAVSQVVGTRPRPGRLFETLFREDALRTNASVSAARPGGYCGTSRRSGRSLRAVRPSDRSRVTRGPW